MLGGLILFLGSIFFLKVTVSIRSMEKHIDEIVFELRDNNLKGAQTKLSMIVRRDTAQLDEQHILSAMIECIGEINCRRDCFAIILLFIFWSGGGICLQGN